MLLRVESTQIRFKQNANNGTQPQYTESTNTQIERRDDFYFCRIFVSFITICRQRQKMLESIVALCSLSFYLAHKKKNVEANELFSTTTRINLLTFSAFLFSVALFPSLSPLIYQLILLLSIAMKHYAYTYLCAMKLTVSQSTKKLKLNERKKYIL